MACLDWKDIRKNFRVDQLIGLYIRSAKKCQVYQNPIGGVKWQGWEIQAGQIMGKVYTWVDSSPIYAGTAELDVDGLFICFEGTSATNGKKYYVRVEKGLIDWPHLENQLTLQRKQNLGWYDNFAFDMEQSYCEVQKKVEYYAYWGLGILGALFIWDNYLKYEFLAYRAKKIFKGSNIEIKRKSE